MSTERDFDKELEKILDAANTRNATLVWETVSFYPPNEEPKGWDLNGAVTLDVLLMEMRLIAARIVYHDLNALTLKRLEATENHLKERGAVWSVQKLTLFLPIIRNISRLFKSLFDEWNARKYQKEIERAIRDAVFKGQRNVWNARLLWKRGHKRRVKVSTRHALPLQRRPNGSKPRKDKRKNHHAG